MKISYNVTVPEPEKTWTSGRHLSETNQAIHDFLDSDNETMRIEFADAAEAKRQSCNILTFRRRRSYSFTVVRRDNEVYIVKTAK